MESHKLLAGLCSVFLVIILVLVGVGSWLVNYQVQVHKGLLHENFSKDIFFDNYQVPSNQTNYICKGFDLTDDLGVKKNHAITFTANLDNWKVVHHMIVYACSEPMLTDYFQCLDTPPECATFIYGWAPCGNNTYEMPSEAGYPFGGETGYKYIILQIHYNNPMHYADEIDSSGVTIQFTPILRTYDAGVYTIGVGQFEIPPNNSHYEVFGGCTGNKTAVTFNIGPVKVFGVGLHAHLLGRQLFTEQYRDGYFIGYLGRDLNYDFSRQGFTPINGVMKPGDGFIHHCIYDSTNKTAPTFSGPSTEDEMCINFVLYYPEVKEKPFCFSSFTNKM